MKRLIVLLISLFTLVSVASANPRQDASPWVSYIDKKYEQRNKALFDKFAQARELLNQSDYGYKNVYKAQALLDEIIKADRKFAPAHREYARFLIMTGQWVDENNPRSKVSWPEATIQRALKLEPDYADAYVLLGHVYNLLGMYGEAFQVLSKAAQMGTEIPWLALNFADLYEAIDKDSLALTIYLNVAERGTPNKSAYVQAVLGAADTYWGLRELEKADAMYTQLLDYDDTIGSVWAQYSRFSLLANEDVDTAIAAGVNAVERFNSGYHRNILALAMYTKWAFLQADADDAESKYYFDSAYELNPNIDEVIEELDGRSYSGITADKLREWLKS